MRVTVRLFARLRDIAGSAELTRQAVAMKAEVVVWPETARPKAVYARPDRPAMYAMPEVQKLAKESGVTIVAGAEYVVTHDAAHRDAYNAVFVVHPDGRLDPTYNITVPKTLAARDGI